AWRVGVVAPLDAAKAESRGGCLWGNRGRAGNGAASQKGPTNTALTVRKNSTKILHMHQPMSALPPKATLNATYGNVRFGPIADTSRYLSNVRQWPKSGFQALFDHFGGAGIAGE